MYGPVSDLIPSSPIFEMYPLGFLTIVSYLEERGYSVRVVNLALRMMNDTAFDVQKFISKLKPIAFGIDLHWLPHAHGSLEVARIVKEEHPDIPVIFGGLSSTYYHEELIRYPQVDYVLRGDSIEPPLYKLMRCIESEKPVNEVQNLTWKKEGLVKINPMSFVPDSLDYVDIRPDLMIKMVIRYRDLGGVLPFDGWWNNPITAIFTVKGCAHECITCGSSKKACQIVTKRWKPAYRSPESLIKNMLEINSFSKGPIFLVGDIRQAGGSYAVRLLNLLKREKIENEIIFELFDVASKGFLNEVDSSVVNWSLEISPESHYEEVRKIQDSTILYSNGELEKMIEHALSLNCHRFDIFFIIGLPKQTRQSVMDTISYCGHLLNKHDRRLSTFISPMGPFLDPGSKIFERPEEYGYKLFARTLEEHRQLLTRSSWKYVLNYETAWMSRDELVEATYDAAERLNQLKLEYGRIDKSTWTEVVERIKQARKLKKRLDNHENKIGYEQSANLVGEFWEFSISTICDKQELYWPSHPINFKPIGILKMLLKPK